jgi:hypothetical protein
MDSDNQIIGYFGKQAFRGNNSARHVSVSSLNVRVAAPKM